MFETNKDKIRHSLLHSARISIISHLSSKPQNITELQKGLSIDRSTVCYHLNILEDVGILESKYVILQATHSKGRAGRIYSINPVKLREAIKAIDELKSELKV